MKHSLVVFLFLFICRQLLNPYKLNNYYYFQVIYETLSPTWNQMLIIDDITMPFPGFYMKSNPPLITIELFDQDTIVSFNCCLSEM